MIENKHNFKPGDRIIYRGHQYEIVKIDNNFYDLKAIPPYDSDGMVSSVGPGGEDGMKPVPKNHQMTVGELIYELKKFNQEAKVYIGDNFYNRISISFGYSENCAKKNCQFVGFNIADEDNTEKN